MRSVCVILPGLMLAACATTAAVEPEPIEQRETASEATCDADDAQQFVGERASAETGARIRALTSARIFQWVPPDSAVTMDFRPDRVRVHYDRSMIITQVICG